MSSENPNKNSSSNSVLSLSNFIKGHNMINNMFRCCQILSSITTTTKQQSKNTQILFESCLTSWICSWRSADIRSYRLHLSDQQVYCLLMCDLYYRFDGISICNANNECGYQSSTHRVRDQMDVILQTTFSNEFCWIIYLYNNLIQISMMSNKMPAVHYYIYDLWTLRQRRYLTKNCGKNC